MKEVHPARGRIGNVLANSSIFQVTFFMTSATGHVHDVAAILINCRIKKIVRKKIIRLAKMVCQVSLTVVHSPWVSKGSLPRTLHSLTLIVVISLTARVDDQLAMLIVTPLISLGMAVCMTFCILTTKMRIIEKPATKMTGLKIKSIMTLKLRYFPIHQEPHPSSHLSLKKSIERTIIGDAIIKIRRNATLMILARKSSASHKVYIKITTNLRENEIVNASAPAEFSTFI